MREIFTYGSVGGAPGNRCFYLELENKHSGFQASFPVKFKILSPYQSGRLSRLFPVIQNVNLPKLHPTITINQEDSETSKSHTEP